MEISPFADEVHIDVKDRTLTNENGCNMTVNTTGGKRDLTADRIKINRFNQIVKPNSPIVVSYCRILA